MKQYFYKDTVDVSNSTRYIYVNQNTGNDSGYAFNDVNAPVKTLQGAFNAINAEFSKEINPLTLKEKVIIKLQTDVNITELLKINNSILSITLDGNNYKITSVSTITNYTKKGDTVTFYCDDAPLSIFVNGVNYKLSEQCASSDADHYTKVTHYSIIEDESGTKYIKANKPTNINITGQESVLLHRYWYVHYAAIHHFDDNYIYLDTTYSDTGYSRANSYDYYRVINILEFLDNTFYYTKVENKYKVSFKISKDIISIEIPVLTTIASITNCSNLTITNVLFIGNKLRVFSSPLAKQDSLGYIEMLNCSNIRVLNNKFSYTGSYCILIKNNCVRCFIERNLFTNLYGGGIHVTWSAVGHPEESTINRDNDKDLPSYILIKNNLISTIGRFFSDFVGIMASRGKHIKILHNEICDTLYTGISIGWSWGYSNSYCSDIYIAYNHIHHCMQHVLSDGGGIYSLGITKDYYIEYNKVHDVYSRSTNDSVGSCIYMDEGTSATTVRYNILYNSNNIINLNYGRNNIIYSNILYNGAWSMIYNNVAEVPFENLITGNLIKGDCLILRGTGASLASFMYNVLDTSAAIPTGINRYLNYEFPINFRDAESGDFYVSPFSVSDRFMVSWGGDRTSFINLRLIIDNTFGVEPLK